MKKHKDKILGLIISLVFIGLIVWNLDFRQLINTFKIFNYRVLLLFMPIYILSIYIRGARWKYLLCNDPKLTVKEAFYTFTTGNTLNSYLPARAGDFWRAYHVGNKIKESKMKLLGSIILERLIDGISILLILFFAIMTYFKHPWIIKIAFLSAAIFLGALVFFVLLFKTNKTSVFLKKISQTRLLKPFESTIKKISAHIESFISGFEVLNRPEYLGIAFLMSIFAWLLECFVTYVLILGFGQHFGISIAFFVISFIALSMVIPSSSVFVGPYQLAYILALNIYHIPKSQALGIAFIHQITIMILITLITVLYFLKANKSIEELKLEINEGEENERHS